jgi:Tfp pilus assembly protein PilF
MSKPMVVTLPVIMILLDYWPLKRLESKKDNWVLWQLKEKVLFFVLSAVFSIITLFAQHKMYAQYSSHPLGLRITNASVSVVTYLEKTFWPHDLAVFYPFPNQIPSWQVSGTTILIVIISVFVIIMVKRLPYLFTGWLWFFITIAPVIGIIQVGDFAMADRYHYLPSIGIAILLAWGIPSLIKSEDARKKILFPVAIAFLLLLALSSWMQCHYWENSVTLFNHALQTTKNNYLAHDCRGNAYSKLGRYQQAIEDYNQAILMKPDYAEAYNNRGTLYGALGQYQLAMGDFNQAIKAKPDYPDAYYNRGVTYANNGQYQCAIEDYNKAIILKPDHVHAYHNRGTIYLKQGKNKLGCHDAQTACDLKDCQLLKVAKGMGLCH